MPVNENVTPLGSIPLYVSEDVRPLTMQERACLEALPEKLTSGGGQNYITQNKQILDLPEMASFKQIMSSYLNHYTNNVLKLNTNFYITDSWSTRNPKGTWHTPHKHPNSIFSGIYYVDIESGDLEFLFESQYSKTFKFNYNIKEYNTLNSTSWTLGPKPGLMVIFPSWVDHSVTPNLHNADRRMIGWNSFVDDKFGDDDAVDNLTVKGPK